MAPADTGFQIGARLTWEPRQPEPARIFANAAETVRAAEVLVDLVLVDLRGRDDLAEPTFAIAELLEIRASLRAIAGKLRSAADRSSARR